MTLKEYIKLYLKTDEELPFETIKVKYKKNQNIISIGEFETSSYFINSGIVEIGVIHGTDNKIQDFYFPSQFISAYMSYVEKIPSDVYMTCVTDCIVEKIPYSLFIPAQKKSKVAKDLAFYSLQRGYLARVKKEKEMMTKTGEERYLDLFRKRPEIIRQIPDVKIAKFLGIHPASLSRIKKEIYKKKEE